MTNKPKIKYTEDGSPILTVVGIPFTGPVNGKADMVGDWFDKSTNLGPLSEVLCYFDHGKSDDWISKAASEMKAKGDIPEDFEVKGFGKHLIGKAVRGPVTEEGVLYDIILDRNHKWSNLLVRLFEEGHLGASSKASARINDPVKSGRLAEWHVVAMDLTPSSMNPHAKATLNKNIDLEEADMSEKVKVNTEEPEESATTTTDVSKAVEKAFSDYPVEQNNSVSENGGTPTAGEENTGTQGQTLADLVSALIAEVNSLRAEMTKSATQTSERIEGLEKALPILARNISMQLRTTVREQTEKSGAEIEAEKTARGLLRDNQDSRAVSNSPTTTNANSGAPGFN